MEDLLTVNQVAERLSLKPDTIQSWLRKGKLKGIKLGRIWRVYRSDLELLLRGNKETT